MTTTRGYPFPAVSSAMQKAVRRGDAKLAGYWALELWTSGYGQYVWRRLLTISAEVRLIDHIIIGSPGRHFSFREAGMV